MPLDYFEDQKESKGKSKLKNSEKLSAIFIPNDIRMPRMFIPPEQLPTDFFKRPQDFAKFIYAVELLNNWPADSLFAKGKLLKEIGCIGDINAETEALLMENNIDTSEFPENVYDSLKEFLPNEIKQTFKSDKKKSEKSLKKNSKSDTNKSKNDVTLVKKLEKPWKVKKVWFLLY